MTNEQAAEKYAKWMLLSARKQDRNDNGASFQGIDLADAFLAGIEYAERRNAEQHKGVNDTQNAITAPTGQDNEQDGKIVPWHLKTGNMRNIYYK